MPADADTPDPGAAAIVIIRRVSDRDEPIRIVVRVGSCFAVLIGYGNATPAIVVGELCGRAVRICNLRQPTHGVVLLIPRGGIAWATVTAAERVWAAPENST
jgi:hypothetical protein